MSILIIKEAAELDRVSKELVSHIKDTDERIASYLLSEVIHIEEHRNPTRLNHFFSALKGSGQRMNAMHNFVQYFGNLKLNDGASTAITKKADGTQAIKVDPKTGKPSPFGKKDADGTYWNVFYSVRQPRNSLTLKTREAGKVVETKYTMADKKFWEERLLAFAQSRPWYTFQPERPPVAFDVDTKVKNLLSALWREVLTHDAVISQKLMTSLTEAAFDAGIVKEGSELVPDSVKLAEVPENYRNMLHIVVDNTKTDIIKEGDKKAAQQADKPARKPARQEPIADAG